MDFWKSKEWQELSGLLTTAYLPGPTLGGQYLGLHSVRTPNGKMVLAAAVFDDIYPGSNFIEITDEKLLANLRNIRGQFHNVSGTDLPVFYYAYLMSKADFKDFSKTGKTPVVTPIATEEERPERGRLTEEIMELLIKRQTSLADGIDALTTVKLNVLKANYGGARTNEFDLLLSHFYEEVRTFSESMKRDRFSPISTKRFLESVEQRGQSDMQVGARDRLSRLRFVSVKRLRQRIGQALAGIILRNKLGHRSGFEGSMSDKERTEKVRHLAIEIGELLNERGPSLGDVVDALTSVMVTAIEATHGRERAEEFDLLVAQFSAEVRRFYGMRVQ